MQSGAQASIQRAERLGTLKPSLNETNQVSAAQQVTFHEQSQPIV